MIGDLPVSERGRRRSVLVIAAALVPMAIGVALIVTAGTLFRGDTSSVPADAEVAAAMADAGCTLQTFPALGRAHVRDINARVHYNSFPPTSGPHYFAPVDWGFYLDPVPEVQVVHNLEHGGIAVQFGTKVEGATVDQLVEFYKRDPHLLVVAPLEKFDATIALAAWTVPPRKPGERLGRGVGRLALCDHVAVAAFRAFVDAYRGKGPEIEPPR